MRETPRTPRRQLELTRYRPSEQHRLTAEERAAKQELDAAEADIGGWQDVLQTAIKLAGNCHAA